MAKKNAILSYVNKIKNNPKVKSCTRKILDLEKKMTQLKKEKKKFVLLARKKLVSKKK